jgi:hypothetical protein
LQARPIDGILGRVSPLAAALFVFCALALLVLPLRWASVPLLIGTCYMTLGQEVTLGPFHFPVLRLLILVGLIRVALRGEGFPGLSEGLDRWMLAWGAWAVVSSLFHEDAGASLVNRLGLVFNGLGTYVLFRVFCRSMADLVNVARVIAWILVPLTIEMIAERQSGRNLFAEFGNVNESPELRGNVLRAQGPFAHPILAGSVGAACLPLMVGIWRSHRLSAIVGIVECLMIVYASASSGPILSAACACVALAMWPLRHRMRSLRWSVYGVCALLALVMNAPVYFLLARIDLTGSSTGWHRAELIHVAIKHFSEWWLVGTDFTRHWMPYGVGWSENHIDITNYYINMGVYGGLPLMLLFIAVLAKGFSSVGAVTSRSADAPGPPGSCFTMWTLGAALFTHAATFVSISYFDQSVVFLYLVLAATLVMRSEVRLTAAVPAQGAAARAPAINHRAT